MVRWHLTLTLALLGALGVSAYLLPDELPVLTVQGSQRNWVTDLADEADRARALDASFAELNRLRDIRAHLILDLQNGSCEFDQTLASFRLVNEHDAICWACLKQAYSESSEGELLCYQMLVAVSARTWSDQEKDMRKELVSRIERHLQSQQLLESNLLQRLHAADAD